MKTPLQRIRRGAVFLAAVVLVAVLGYRLVGFDWIESVWIVVVTLSSVGLSESSQQPPGMQVFTIVVILVGLTAAVYTIGGFIQMVTEGEVDRALGHRRITREIKRLSGHVIICGFGRVGQILAASLEQINRPFIVIESDAERIEEAREHGYLFLVGDATDEVILLEAGVRRAVTLVSTLPNDAANVFITLTSRNL